MYVFSALISLKKKRPCHVCALPFLLCVNNPGWCALVFSQLLHYFSIFILRPPKSCRELFCMQQQYNNIRSIWWCCIYYTLRVLRTPNSEHAAEVHAHFVVLYSVLHVCIIWYVLPEFWAGKPDATSSYSSSTACCCKGKEKIKILPGVRKYHDRLRGRSWGEHRILVA